MTENVKPTHEELSALLLTFLSPPTYSGGSWTYNPSKAADAVLALLPGRTEAEVKAEAWLEGYWAAVNDIEDGVGDAPRENPYRA